MNGLRHPVFNPLWRRVAMTVFLVGWTIFELTMGNTYWGTFFAAVSAVCGWVFFVDWKDVDPEDKG